MVLVWHGLFVYKRWNFSYGSTCPKWSFIGTGDKLNLCQWRVIVRFSKQCGGWHVFKASVDKKCLGLSESNSLWTNNRDSYHRAPSMSYYWNNIVFILNLLESLENRLFPLSISRSSVKPFKLLGVIILSLYMTVVELVIPPSGSFSKRSRDCIL